MIICKAKEDHLQMLDHAMDTPPVGIPDHP